MLGWPCLRSPAKFSKDPPVLKMVRRANSLRGEKNATAIAKRYGECSEVLVFLGKRGRKTVRMLKTTAVAKYYGTERRTIFSTEGSFGFNLGEARPGGFQTGGVFALFSGKVQIVSRTLSGLFLVGALNRQRKRQGTNRENPRRVPEQIGKIPENRESPKKDKKGRTSPDRETPPFETPPFSGP